MHRLTVAVLSHLSFSFLVFLSFASFSEAQLTTGIPPFSTVGGGPDQINLGDLGIHYTFPVLSRAGRIPFSYVIGWDNAVWTKSPAVGGYQWSVSLGGVLTPIGGAFYTLSQKSCHDSVGDPETYNIWTFTEYQDMQGTTHPFNLKVNDSIGPDGTCPAGTSTASATSSDMSGVSLTVNPKSPFRGCDSARWERDDRSFDFLQYRLRLCGASIGHLHVDRQQRQPNQLQLGKQHSFQHR